MFEYTDNVKTFEDPDIISLDSIESENFTNVNEEIERGQRLSEERKYWKKEKCPEIRPLFEKDLKNLKSNRRAVYRQIVDRMKPIYPEICNHCGNFIIDRSILTRDEHINFLSFPKCIKYPMREEYVKVYYKKIFLPNSTARIEKLATPNLRLMENTMKNFSHYLKARQLENLTYIITGRHFEKIVTVDKALTLIQQERDQKQLVNRKLKEEIKAMQDIIKSKRLKQIQQIVWSLFEVMKEYLITEHAVNLKSEMRLLSNFIVHNIAEFAGFEIPSCNSQEFIDKFIIDLADNLTIWLEKFTTSFGFNPLIKEGSLPKRKFLIEIKKYSKDTNEFTKYPDVCKELKTKTIDDFRDGNGSIYLPIDDYIALSEPSISDYEDVLSNKVCEGAMDSAKSENILSEEK